MGGSRAGSCIDHIVISLNLLISLSVAILARIIMEWKLGHLYTPERNSKNNKLFFFNDELFYSISFGKMMTIGLIISFSGLVTW